MLEILFEIKKVMDNFLPFALGMIGFFSISSAFAEMKPQKPKKKSSPPHRENAITQTQHTHATPDNSRVA